MTRRHEILSEIVTALADVEDCQPHELEYSLYDHVDPEAIIALVASDQTDWQLTIHVPDHTVEIRGDGQIRVDDGVPREVERSSQQSN